MFVGFTGIVLTFKLVPLACVHSLSGTHSRNTCLVAAICKCTKIPLLILSAHTIWIRSTISRTSEDILDHNSLDAPSQEWHEAAYILYIKENHVKTQAAIDTILPHTNELFSFLLEKVSSELKTKLSDEAMEFVEQTHSHVLPMFSNLSTRYLQRKFFREQFSLVVSLIPCEHVFKGYY
jgi:hypothetical protein